jgi:hypothetical protein
LNVRPPAAAIEPDPSPFSEEADMEEKRRGSSELLRRQMLLGSAIILATQACQATSPTPIAPAGRGGSKVDLAAFVSDCVAASAESVPQAAVKEVLARGVHDPRAMLAAVGESDHAGIRVLHRAPTLTIFAATWTPQMNLMPHNHRMWPSSASTRVARTTSFGADRKRE